MCFTTMDKVTGSTHWGPKKLHHNPLSHIPPLMEHAYLAMSLETMWNRNLERNQPICNLCRCSWLIDSKTCKRVKQMLTACAHDVVNSKQFLSVELVTCLAFHSRDKECFCIAMDPTLYLHRMLVVTGFTSVCDVPCAIHVGFCISSTWNMLH